MTAAQVEKHTIRVSEQTLVVLLAKPQKSSKKSDARPVLYVGGHNLRPKKDDDVVKASYDMQELADTIGCDIYGVILSSQGSYSTALATGYPKGVAITQLHKTRAAAMMLALKKAQKERLLQEVPLDVIGFSDGGILALALAYEDPQAFRFIMIVNTPGLDGHQAKTKYAYAFLEGWHLSFNFAKKMLRSKSQRVRLSFKGKSRNTLSAKENILRQFVEKHAIARTQIHELIPHVVIANKKLVIQLITTNNDAFALPKQVKKVVERVLPKAVKDRVLFSLTGWEIHTMGYFVTIRKQKLYDIASWMRALRENK